MPTEFDVKNTQNYAVDIDNYAGLQYDAYLGVIAGVSVADPKLFYKIRSQIMLAVKREALQKLYKTFYDVLSTGRCGDLDIANMLGADGVAPNYPAQETSQLALDACSALMPVIDKVISKLMPLNGSAVAEKRMAEISLSTK